MNIPSDNKKDLSKVKLENDLKKLRIEYDKTISKKLEDFQKLQNDAKKDTSLDNLSALRFFVHKLAGNAGTYGYDEVSVICKQYELEILEVLKNPSALKWMDRWDSYYEKVKIEFHHA